GGQVAEVVPLPAPENGDALKLDREVVFDCAFGQLRRFSSRQLGGDRRTVRVERGAPGGRGRPRGPHRDRYPLQAGGGGGVFVRRAEQPLRALTGVLVRRVHAAAHRRVDAVAAGRRIAPARPAAPVAGDRLDADGVVLDARAEQREPGAAVDLRRV